MKHYFFFSPIRLTKMEKLDNFQCLLLGKGYAYNIVDGSTGAIFAGQFGSTTKI